MLDFGARHTANKNLTSAYASSSLGDVITVDTALDTLHKAQTYCRLHLLSFKMIFIERNARTQPLPPHCWILSTTGTCIHAQLCKHVQDDRAHGLQRKARRPRRPSCTLHGTLHGTLFPLVGLLFRFVFFLFCRLWDGKS